MMARTRSHRGALIAVGLLLAASVAPCANAGTVSVVGSTLTFTAAAGETNLLFIGESHVQDDGAPLTAGAGCALQTASTAACSTPWSMVSVSLGDQADTLSLLLSPGSTGTASGGPGNDTMSSGFETVTFNGGPGNDQLFGSGSGDVLNGDDDADVISGGGQGTLKGGAGNDNLSGGIFDVIDGQ